MEAVECIHCGVLMTGWSAPGSPVRYWQCPFCARTHSSPYGEVFRRAALARGVAAPRPAPSTPPQATPEEVRWAALKARAARWFERLEREQRRVHPPRPPARVSYQPAPACSLAPRHR